MKNKKSYVTIGLLGLLILLTVLLCIFIFNTINQVFFDAGVKQTTETMQVIRDLGIYLVDDKLEALEQNLEETAISYSGIIAETVSEGQTAGLSNLELPQDGIEYCLATPDGMIWGADNKKQHWEKEQGLEAVFASGETTIIDPYFDKDGNYILSIATPLRKDNQVYALLIVRLDGFCISRWLETIDFQTGEGTAYIITGDGRNIATTRKENYDWITSMYNAQELADVDQESKTIAELERQPLEGKSDSGSYLWKGSRNYLVYAPMKQTNWGFFVGFYGDLMDNYIRESAEKSIVSSVPFIAAVLLFILFLVLYANYNLRKERKYVRELLHQKQEIERQSEDISANEERFRVALAQTKNIIFEYDPLTGGITNFYATKVNHISSSLEDLKKQFIVKGVIDDESLIQLHEMLNNTHTGAGNSECTIKVLFPNETVAWYKVSISSLAKQHVRIIGIIENITKEKLGELDPLTRLLNQKVFSEKIVSYLKTIKGEVTYALLIFDIDDFKTVNDQFGHPMGDQVIIQTGMILKRIFPQGTFVGRIGGDEFGVFCPELFSVQKFKDTLNIICGHPHFIEGDLSVTYSCGVYLSCGTDHLTFAEIYKHADSALYKAKQQGKNRYCISSESKTGNACLTVIGIEE